jgi:hypothetical protein
MHDVMPELVRSSESLPQAPPSAGVDNDEPGLAVPVVEAVSAILTEVMEREVDLPVTDDAPKIVDRPVA